MQMKMMIIVGKMNLKMMEWKLKKINKKKKNKMKKKKKCKKVVLE